ncbi:Esterase/lipase/thioesterase [Nostocoides japonicum T1-X7]|uniref:Esterase/lipase/thioesterase n=1 Tax=Nostocoides japonicum T1-X7 TaxID=1194083 RepID=A0A077M519_9MICO|nr:alpha/beta hydrolase [Tetrasphaera japonica]CCH79165.1 Esterase/lipase/thioesterase [Tetrasphaera japonica T1-X7]
MALDDASVSFVTALAADPPPPFEVLTPGIARLADATLAALSGPGPEVGQVRNLRIDTGGGDRIRIRTLRPKGAPKGVLVYFHGGGWVIGDIDYQYDHVARDLVVATDCTVVLVNYRKAPEHPFPAAVEDSYTGLVWADDHKADLAYDGAPLIVAGDSAGGNLSAVMTQWARDRGGPQVDLQVLVYPVTDCDLDTPSSLAPENQLLLSRDYMVWFWTHYLPEEEARTNPSASPIRADSLAGLPPALVYVAECDPLRDEGVAYAEALRDAGVEVTLDEAEGQMHAYFQMAGILPGYDTGLRRVADYINEFIAGRDCG